MANRIDIAGFGAVAVDELLYVDGKVNDGKARVIETRVDHGGNVGTALVAAASLGASTGFVGKLSSEPMYAHVADDLVSHGVDISHCQFTPEVAPIQSTIIVGNNGERFIAYRDARIEPKEKLSTIDWQGACILLIDSYAADSTSAVKLAYDDGLEIIADIEWSSGSDTNEVMSMTHHLVVPMDFAISATGYDQPARMLLALWSACRQTVVITDGNNGAYLLSDDAKAFWHVPAYEADILDTTGCGDWFHGAYAASLVHEWTPLERVRFANVAAGIAAEGRGGRGKLVTFEEVNSSIAQLNSPTQLCTNTPSS